VMLQQYLEKGFTAGRPPRRRRRRRCPGGFPAHLYTTRPPFTTPPPITPSGFSFPCEDFF